MMQEFYNTMTYKPSYVDTCSPKPHNNGTNIVNIVILLHGRSSNPTQFWKLLPILRQQLPNVHLLTPYLSNPDTKIRHDSLFVIEKFNDYISELGDNAKINLVVIGISKGGLTAADFITRLECNRVIGMSLITISSPLRGTVTASYAFWTRMTKIELDFESPTVNYLEYQVAQLVQLEKVKTYHVVPVIDHIIYPVKSTQYSFSEENYYSWKFTSHNNIQNDPDVINWVIGKVDMIVSS